MTLDRSSELKTGGGNGGVMSYEMSIKGGHLFGCHGKTYKERRPAGKEDPVNLF